MSSRRLVLLAAIPFLLLALRAAAIDITVLPSPELQARYEKLTHEFRCMQCQNNSIADSPVGLASDLRREVKEQLIAGKSDDEIRAYMVQRYGNVILFTPPLVASTAWVWLFPVFAVIGGAVIGVVVVRRRFVVHLGHLVVGDSRQLERVGGGGDVLDWRVGGVDDLDVPVACAVHRTKPGVEVEQGGHHALLFLQAHRGRRNPEPRVTISRRDDVIENVNLHW